jgi:hypothetical protein
MPEDPIQREDTMLYREPTPESAEVVDIWGKKLEARVVDASEVSAMLRDGWVTHPRHIDNPPKPEEAAGFVPVSDTKALQEELDAMRATISRLQGDLAAAEQLVASESKAKDEALARIGDLDAPAPTGQDVADAKPKLGIKKEG